MSDATPATATATAAATAADHILVSVADGIMEIRLNRPEKKNAITGAMYAAMADALQRAGTDPAVRVVLLCGAGDSFTGGNDLKDFLSAPPVGSDSPAWRFLLALRDAGKIVVAAVHGSAVGIGTTLLLHCDLVYAGRSARLALPFARLGLVPEAGSSLLLPRLVGHQRATELLVLGEPFDADTAHTLGLVNRVVEDADLAATARAAAAAVAALPAEAVAETKRLLKRGVTGLADCMEEEIGVFKQRLHSEEFRAMATAFLEKRSAG